MAADLAVCYVADPDFLFPTVVSACSLRRFVAAADADIFIFVLNPDAGDFEGMVRFARCHAINLIPLNIERHFAFDDARWNVTHVPQSTLGRFFIGDELPARFKRMIYIDGDTLFVQNPRALIDYMPPDGTFAAAEDISFFCRNDWSSYGRATRAYFMGLGLTQRSGYFNAGVFLVGCATWRVLAQEAFAFFRSNTEKCRYHDQSALNAVVGDRRVRLSPAWNFQTPFRYWGMQNELQPRIYHFTEFPKPWMGRIEPWVDFYPLFTAQARDLAPFGLPIRQLSDQVVRDHNTGSGRKRLKLQSFLAYRLLARQRELRRVSEIAVL